MTLEEVLFARKSPCKDKLIEYGFSPQGEDLFYTEDFGGSFRAEIRIHQEHLSGKVIDTDTEEEFRSFRIRDDQGAFSAEIKAQYIGILERIAAACFREEMFLERQSRALAAYLKETYDDECDHPFKAPNPAVSFRVNGSWYGLLMEIPYERLIPKKEGSTEVLNLKADPEKIPQLVQREGIFPAYHMNKKNWISVLLDGSLSNEEVFALAAKSRRLTADKKRAAGGSDWVIPADPKVYDIEAAFARSPIHSWHRHTAVMPGEQVYIYYGAPFSCLLYRCLVLSVDEDGKGMLLEAKEKYPREKYPLKKLQAYGLKSIRGARRIPAELQQLLDQEKK